MRTIVPGVRTLVLIIIATAFGLQSHSQSITTGNGKIEVGLGFGPLFFLGDLGGNHGEGQRFVKDVNFSVTNIAKGIYVNIYPVEWLGFRVALNQGRLEGYDSLIRDKGDDEYFRKKRNLQFRSNLWEAYGAIELYPTVFFERYDGLQGKFRPYGLIGAGIFKFKPQGRYYDASGRAIWVDLQPLHLEGQGMAEYPDRPNYKLHSFEIPIGAGFKYYLKENMYIGFEIVHRKSFSDYVDDVSKDYIDANLFANYLTGDQAAMANQLYFREGFIPGTPLPRVPTVGEQRGNPKQNDSYFSSILRFGWRLNDSNSPNGRAARQMRCPAFY
jgi:hypothetical protein